MTRQAVVPPTPEPIVPVHEPSLSGLITPEPAHLPRDILALKYIGEGSANVVFEVFLRNPDINENDENNALAAALIGRLLRVQKKPRDPAKPFFPVTELMDYFDANVRPKFAGGLLVSQAIARLDEGFVDEINASLAIMDSSLDGPRKEKFRGSRAARVPFGMLVEDMRPNGPNERGFELKPKWLLESPAAPQDAIRCRTCAVSLKQGTPVPCPLYLTQPFLNQPIHPHPLPLSPSDPAMEAVKSSLTATGIIERLKQLQYALDRHGPSRAGADDAGLPLAMTLRDCTLFCRIRQLSGGRYDVSVKLGDLDRKNAEVKLEGWRASELELIEGAYYIRPAADGTMSCLIERETPTEREIRLVPPSSLE